MPAFRLIYLIPDSNGINAEGKLDLYPNLAWSTKSLKEELGKNAIPVSLRDASISPVIKDFFAKKSVKSDYIVLKGVSKETLELIVKYMEHQKGIPNPPHLSIRTRGFLGDPHLFNFFLDFNYIKISTRGIPIKAVNANHHLTNAIIFATDRLEIEHFNHVNVTFFVWHLLGQSFTTLYE